MLYVYSCSSLLFFAFINVVCQVVKSAVDPGLFVKLLEIIMRPIRKI